MDMRLNADQRALVEAAEQMTADLREAPRQGLFTAYSVELQRRIANAEFASIQLQEGYGPLEAALVVETLGRVPALAEASASLVVAPAVLGETVEGPISLVETWRRPARFLSVARHAFIQDGDAAYLIAVDPDKVQTAPAILAYPYGRFIEAPDFAGARRLDQAQTQALKQWSQVAMALDAAAAMASAVEFTAEYVKQRRQFNQPIGAFQAVQHRIAKAAVHAEGARFLALEAAWKGDALTASLSATYVQRFLGEVIEDLHQFNGALGITLEHPLHYWTYRLVGLQSELGGLSTQSRTAADLVWPDDSQPIPANERATAYSALGW
jgi:alkylation response protein AidB-like acyl-CoA dehydrogenase